VPDPKGSGKDRLRAVGSVRDARARHPSALARHQDEPSSAPDIAPRAAPDIQRERDPLGKMALFSTDRPAHTYGTLLIECSACRRESPVSVSQLVRSAFPFSLHVPLVKRYHSLMRCPACGRRTWVRVSWRP
jgi:hypothetical protein